jgi:uncharacterized membrane protein YcaP (DUF421 family)
MVGFATIILVHMLVTFVTSRNTSIYWIFASPARPLIETGRLVQKNLQIERMRAEDVQFELRLKGEEHMREVQESRLEPSGQVSVIKDSSYKPVPKKDKRLFR